MREAGGRWNCSGQRICKVEQYLHLVICKHQGDIRRLGGGGWERGGSVLGQQPLLHQHSRHDMWHIKTHVHSNGPIQGDKKLTTKVSRHHEARLYNLQEQGQSLWGGLAEAPHVSKQLLYYTRDLWGHSPSSGEQRPWPRGQKRYTVGQAGPLNALLLFALRR